jgi:polyisoprenoid-binding protein YceI
MEHKLTRLKLLLLIFFLNSSLPAMADSEYVIDPNHSSLNFSVSHLMVSKTHGVFNDYTGQIRYDPANLSATDINVTIQAVSIDTRLKARDDHLKSTDFLAVANHPLISFRSVGIQKDPFGKFVLTGNLTLRGITKEIAIPITINGPAKNMLGDEVIGIEGQLTINRQDFGVSWNKTMDQGGLVVGNEVQIDFSVEAIQQKTEKNLRVE